jgi:hypothetical protein
MNEMGGRRRAVIAGVLPPDGNQARLGSGWRPGSNVSKRLIIRVNLAFGDGPAPW